MLIGDTGTATITVPIPYGPVHLALSAFSLHPEQGMTILPEPVQWKGSVGVWMAVEAPSRVGIWEQVCVCVCLPVNCVHLPSCLFIYFIFFLPFYQHINNFLLC